MAIVPKYKVEDNRGKMIFASDDVIAVINLCVNKSKQWEGRFSIFSSGGVDLLAQFRGGELVWEEGNG